MLAAQSNIQATERAPEKQDCAPITKQPGNWPNRELRPQNLRCSRDVCAFRQCDKPLRAARSLPRARAKTDGPHLAGAGSEENSNMSYQYELVMHLMSTPVVTLEPTTEVSELLRLSESLDIHHFPLVDASGLVGLVCTCDVKGARPEQPVSELSRRAPVTLPPAATADEAAALMIEENVGSVLIADEGEVWGILTHDDLAETVPELMREIHRECDSAPRPQHEMQRLIGPTNGGPLTQRRACDEQRGSRDDQRQQEVIARLSDTVAPHPSAV
jgi:CBS domain-containing protein